MSEGYETGSQYLMSREALQAADRATQLEIMEMWFRQRFENPAESTPYISREGGYQWICGGPYYARDEIDSEFSEIVPEDVIDELVGKLEEESILWAPTLTAEDYDHELIDDLATITSFADHFAGAILDVEALLGSDVPTSVLPTLQKLLYVNVITAMETYLSDAFINTVVNNQKLLRKFIESYPEFQREKFALSEIYSAFERVEGDAKSALADTVWHRLARVKEMYRSTLEIEFPADMSTLYRAVDTRHDLVHRNGKTKDGEVIYIDRDRVQQLIKDVEDFVTYIDPQIKKLRDQLSES